MLDPKLTREIDQLHAELCSALADPRRIVLLYALAEEPHSVNELAQSLGITQPATSRHLKILRDRGMVRAARQGSTVTYSLADPRLIDALDLLRAVLRDHLSYNAGLLKQSAPAA